MTRMAASPANVADQEISTVSYLIEFDKFQKANPNLNPSQCAESFSAYPFKNPFGPGQQVERSSAIQIGRKLAAPSNFKPESCPQSGTTPLVGSQRMARGNSTQTSSVSPQHAFAIRSGRSPQQFQYTNPIPLSSSFPQRDNTRQFTSGAPSSRTLQSLGLDCTSAPALEEYLTQNNKHEPFNGLNVNDPPGFGGARMAKGFPVLTINPMLNNFSAPQMSHQLSSSPSDCLTGGEDGYTDSPYSLTFPMNRHSRSFSQGSYNSSLFSASQPDSVSPTDHPVFLPESYSMSRQASGASCIPGLSMLRVESSVGSSVTDGMASVYDATNQDGLLNGVGGFVSENGDVSSLDKASAQVVLKRSSSVSVEDLNDSMVKGRQAHHPLSNGPLNPRKQRRIKEEETDSPFQKSTNTVQQQLPEKTSKTETSTKADKTSTMRQSEKKSSGSSRQLPPIKPGKNPNNSFSSTSKSSYIRPPHPRVYCERCTNHPDGFRGDHELRRHTDREHAPTRKMYVIKDISKDGTLLSRCKACQSGKKYGVDYNAAAHLRRQHFKPKIRNGKNRSKIQSTIDQTVPEMAELRKWMEEVEVRVNSGSDDDPNPKRDSADNDDTCTQQGERGSETSEEDNREVVQQMDEREDGRGAIHQTVAEQKIQQKRSAMEAFQDMGMEMETDFESGNPSQLDPAWILDGWTGSAVNTATYTLSNSQTPQQLTHEYDLRVSATTGSVPLVGGPFNHQQNLAIHLPTEHHLFLQESLLLHAPPFALGSNSTTFNFLPADARSADMMFDDPLSGLTEMFPGNPGDLKPY